MKVYSIQCDTCCKQHKVDMEYDVQNLPFGWFTVTPGQGGGFKETLHFCSIACLRDYAVKEVNPILFAESQELLSPAETDRRATPEYWR